MNTQTECKSERTSFMQYVNTALLAFIFGIAMLIFNKVSDISDTQTEQGIEQIRTKTILDITVANVKELTARVTTIENDRMVDIQTWIDERYIRKPQK